MTNKDSLQRFLFEDAAIRGEIVRLNATWQEVLQRHEYPHAVSTILGQMMAASALLSAMLKFEGSLTMQIQGKGQLKLAVVECTSERAMRAIAHFDADVRCDDLLELVGPGCLAITIEPKQGRRYQGIVDLTSGDLAKAIEGYMQRSQQLETKIWLTADRQQVAGMMLQKLPQQDDISDSFHEEDVDAWNRISHLAATVQPQELTDLAFEELLRRLFFEENLRLFDVEPVRFRCSCSKERVSNTLRLLGYDELKPLLESDNKVSVNCEFCNHLYEFDSVDIELLFADAAVPGDATVRH